MSIVFVVIPEKVYNMLTGYINKNICDFSLLHFFPFFLMREINITTF